MYIICFFQKKILAANFGRLTVHDLGFDDHFVLIGTVFGFEQGQGLAQIRDFNPRALMILFANWSRRFEKVTIGTDIDVEF